MKRISASDTVPTPPPILKKAGERPPPTSLWRSSFQSVDKKEGNSEVKAKGSEERPQLYDPCSPLSSDSESEKPKTQHHKPSPNIQDKSVECQRLSPDRRCRQSSPWESHHAEPGRQLVDKHNFPTRPTENRGLSPRRSLREIHAYSPERKTLDRPGYGLKGGPKEKRVCSPDRVPHGSSDQPYRGRRTNGEERTTLPEYRREMPPTRRPSPPRLKRDHQQLGHVETAGLNQDPLPAKVTREAEKAVPVDRCPITCDLCDVELANAQELEDHLDCKSHWNTLEHIQQNNKYDDLAIAFLQEVMLYKSRHCSQAVEEKALQALQEKDHMTKVEMLHCAACKVYVSTSAADVHIHVTSQGHLSKAKEFEAVQRHACLGKAETMLKELKPQFEDFLKGGSPFE
ncbi:DBIRD complex subunit ZNF326 [Nematolebias whitei]|uniref:DBIRD complex subunit ZNF326 n=1 Tax=Nematolebias whitei TaxID=451745 RepID=UPI001897E48E|nr:DBIRD complex subunit ZNF326 [Nematolebias whitei]